MTILTRAIKIYTIAEAKHAQAIKDNYSFTLGEKRRDDKTVAHTLSSIIAFLTRSPR
jgi:hypothetical protein